MLSRPQGRSAAGRIMSVKNYNDNIGKRTGDLPVYSAVLLRDRYHINLQSFKITSFFFLYKNHLFVEEMIKGFS